MYISNVSTVRFFYCPEHCSFHGMSRKIYTLYAIKVSPQNPAFTYNLVTWIRSSIRLSGTKLNRMRAGVCNAFICYTCVLPLWHCGTGIWMHVGGVFHSHCHVVIQHTRGWQLGKWKRDDKVMRNSEVTCTRLAGSCEGDMRGDSCYDCFSTHIGSARCRHCCGLTVSHSFIVR
jgi:predicted DNA-binding transcriptional regulator AlpA